MVLRAWGPDEDPAKAKAIKCWQTYSRTIANFPANFEKIQDCAKDSNFRQLSSIPRKFGKISEIFTENMRFQSGFNKILKTC